MVSPVLGSPAARATARARVAAPAGARVPRLPDDHVLLEAWPAATGGGTGLARHVATGARRFVKWSDAPDRLVREAAILKALDHPGIVRLHAARRSVDQGLLLLELIEGESLEAMCARAGGRLDGALLTALARRLADALGALHAMGYLHRDLKPGNVMVRPDGRPVIVDLGAALPLAGPDLDDPHSLLTDSYAAPEQYADDQPEGPWTDVYGLGALCYRAMTGQAPPAAPERLRGAPMAPALEAAGDYPPGLRRAVDRALALAPEDRPQSIAEWAEMLDAPDAPADATAHPPSEADDLPPTVQVRRIATRRLSAPPADERAAAPPVAVRRSGALPWALLAALLVAALGVGAWYGPAWYERHLKTEWLVDPADGGDTTTIGAALARAGDRATIRISPGEYAESLVLVRPVHLVAAVRDRPPTIAPPAGPCIAAMANGGSVTGLVLRASQPADPATPTSPCLLVGAAGTLIEGNRIEGGPGPAVSVESGATPLLRDNLVQGGEGPALVVAEGAKGRFEDNTIEEVAGLGLIVRGGAAPEIVGTTFQASGGALFAEGAAGRFAGNRMIAIRGSAIRVTSGADPDVTDNLIEDPAESAVFVYDHGRGRFSGNTISGSRLSGVVVADGAAVELRDNTIRDAGEHGVLVLERGRAALEDNTIVDNAGHGIALGWDVEVELNGNRVEGNTEPQLLDARQG